MGTNRENCGPGFIAIYEPWTFWPNALFCATCNFGLLGAVAWLPGELETSNSEWVFIWLSSAFAPCLAKFGFGTTNVYPTPKKNRYPWENALSKVLLPHPEVLNSANQKAYESPMLIIVWQFVSFWASVFPQSSPPKTMQICNDPSCGIFLFFNSFRAHLWSLNNSEGNVLTGAMVTL